jgi:hypothetical protein
MKQKLVIAVLGLFLLSGCGKKNDQEENQTKREAVKTTYSEAELLQELKDLTQNDLKKLPLIDQQTGEVSNTKFYDGSYSETTEDKAIEIVKKLKSKFRDSGYLIFVFEGDSDSKGVALIKGTDDLDIIRYRRTDGINYGLENADVVEKIAEWKSKYGLVVIGCGRDWLHIEFDKLPGDLDAFSQEVYKFCPDSVDQGVGSLENLKPAIKEMNGLWLWWD